MNRGGLESAIVPRREARRVTQAQGMKGMRRLLCGAAAACVLLACAVQAVDRSKFRKCGDTSFCRRHRNKGAMQQYSVVAESLKHGDGKVTALLRSSSGEAALRMEVSGFAEGIARLRVTEAAPKTPRWEAPDVLDKERLAPVAVGKAEVAGNVATIAVGGESELRSRRGTTAEARGVDSVSESESGGERSAGAPWTRA